MTVRQERPVDMSPQQSTHFRKAPYAPRYNLDAIELSQIDKEVVELVRKEHGDIVASVWAPPTSAYANVVRTHEAAIFPEIPELMSSYEHESAFLMMVDARPGADRVVRGTRVASPLFTEGQRPGAAEGKVNIPMLQDMVASGQVSEAEILAYYGERGIDIDHCFSVETNFRIGERAERLNGAPLAQLGYLAMFNYAVRLGSSSESSKVSSVIFAHVNKGTIDSFKLLGIEHEPFVGRNDLHTPSTGGKFDEHYIPAAYYATPHVKAVFANLASLAPPEIHV